MKTLPWGGVLAVAALVVPDRTIDAAEVEVALGSSAALELRAKDGEGDEVLPETRQEKIAVALELSFELGIHDYTSIPEFVRFGQWYQRGWPARLARPGRRGATSGVSRLTTSRGMRKVWSQPSPTERQRFTAA